MKKIKLVWLVIYFTFYSYWIRLRMKSLMKKSPEKRYHLLMKGFLKVEKILNINFEVVNNNRLTNSPQLIVVNHRSNADATLLGIAHDNSELIPKNKPLIYIAKESINKIFIFRPFIKMTPIFLIDRQNLRQSVKIIRDVSKTSWENKYSISVFPEGTRNKTEEPLLPFKPGAMKFSQLNKMPIIPCVFINNEEILNKKRKTKINVKLIVGKEIPYYKLEHLSTQELSDLISKEMIKY